MGPKWRFISSHSMRRSFVTNLTVAGVPLADTAKMAGHRSNTTITQRYNCDYKASILAKAMAYLGVNK
ncbi:MAG: tyrosine-type recombinase/integrase [Bacteroidales bacterium]|nr:tyrosine-type recombinase/integrase [Bacteroidales bacterium]